MKVISSNIRDIEYDRQRHTLMVIFHNRPRLIYTYKNVSPKLWVGLIQAESKGKYLESHIKNNHRYTKASL